jgi:hypothetical protein
MAEQWSSVDARWARVAARLAPAPSYWLGTVNRDGSPHAAPVWGVVIGTTLYLYSERSTVKAGNVARDGRVVIHLESAEDVVIVHGSLDDVGHPRDFPEVVEALDSKYPRPGDRQYLPSHNEEFDVVYRLRPTKALSWDLADYEGSQRRWTAG